MLMRELDYCSVDLTPCCLGRKDVPLAPNPYGHADDEEPRMEISKPIWDALRGNMLKDILAYHGFWDQEVGEWSLTDVERFSHSERYNISSI